MPTTKDLDSKTTLTAKKSSVEKVAIRRKKNPYEVPPRKVQLEALMHKSRFRPSNATSNVPEVLKPDAAMGAPEVVDANVPASEVPNVAPEVVLKPEAPQPEVSNDETAIDIPDDLDMNKVPVATEVEREESKPGPDDDMNEPPETAQNGSEGEEESNETPEASLPTDPTESVDYYTEYYVNGYCQRKDRTEQYYAQDELHNEYYWRDSVGAQIYANRAKKIDGVLHRVEFPALKNGEAKYIKDREGKPRYPVDLDTQTVVFPEDPLSHEEIYLTDKYGEIYSAPPPPSIPYSERSNKNILHMLKK